MTSVETLAVALLGTLAAKSERVTHVGPRRTRVAPSADLGLDAGLEVVTSCVHGLDADLDIGFISDAGRLFGGSDERVPAGLSAEWDFGRRHASIVVDGPEPCQYLLTGASHVRNGDECDHHWLDRPESDTRECLICGAEVAG